MVNSDDYTDAQTTIEDSCSHCYLPIEVDVDHVEVAHLDPDTVWVQQGGG
ncbi:MAG: hypothetical protein IIA44_11865 [Acidobacteria bacterium]|nr:hypothetical protein [Acidobacteriota bacterium]